MSADYFRNMDAIYCHDMDTVYCQNMVGLLPEYGWVIARIWVQLIMIIATILMW